MKTRSVVLVEFNGDLGVMDRAGLRPALQLLSAGSYAATYVRESDEK